MTDPWIARYYDRLTRWNQMARAFGYGGGGRSLTVHRALADRARAGATSTARVHDLLIENLPRLYAPRVLDAGCGLGGTILALAERFPGGVHVGLTLSRAQASIAERAFDAAGLGGAAQVLVQTYDEPPAGPFDLIVAIESLAHSPAPHASLSALASRLAPSGLIAIVDDMPAPGAEESPDLQRFLAGWRCPVLWGLTDYQRAFAALGLETIVDLDLSDECRPRELGTIRRLERLNRTAHGLIPSAGFREVMDSHFAGLALERLSRNGLMRYRMLIGRLQ